MLGFRLHTCLAAAAGDQRMSTADKGLPSEGSGVVVPRPEAGTSVDQVRCVLKHCCCVESSTTDDGLPVFS
jgi:hypothetical protein